SIIPLSVYHPAPTEIYTLSLHDALPILRPVEEEPEDTTVQNNSRARRVPGTAWSAASAASDDAVSTSITTQPISPRVWRYCPATLAPISENTRFTALITPGRFSWTWRSRWRPGCGGSETSGKFTDVTVLPLSL